MIRNDHNKKGLIVMLSETIFLRTICLCLAVLSIIFYLVEVELKLQMAVVQVLQFSFQPSSIRVSPRAVASPLTNLMIFLGPKFMKEGDYLLQKEKLGYLDYLVDQLGIKYIYILGFSRFFVSFF